MGIIGKQKFSQEKMDKLHEYVRLYAEKGKPVEYEIMVDGFRAVRRTNDPDMFMMYESFVHHDSRYVEVLFFTGASHNNDKHIFTLQDEPKETGLSGIEVESKIQQKMDEQKKDWEREQLTQENNDLKNELAEMEDEIDTLEKQLEGYKSSESPLKGMLGEFGASMLESFVKRNPDILAKLPGGTALSGLVDSSPAKPLEDDGEVSFKTSTHTAISTEDQQSINFVKELKEKFDRQEFIKILHVLKLLGEDKERISEVVEYLTAETEDQKDEQVHI